MMCQTEREVFEANPTQHARIALLVGVAMAQYDEPCRGGECDDDGRCARHRRFDAVRFVRLTKRWRGAK